MGAALAAALALPVGALGASAISGAPESAISGGATAPAHTHAKSSACAGSNLRPNRVNAAAVDAATLCLLNQMRSTYHLLPLQSNHELQAVATKQVRSMVQRDYFGDNSPSGQSPGALIATIPYGAHAASLSTAQDLGWGTLSDATAAGMVAAWMRSLPHREVILTAEFRDAGIGVAPAVPSVLGRGKRGATYAVEFGERS
jgi:uncharacterized protein YkwD